MRARNAHACRTVLLEPPAMCAPCTGPAALNLRSLTKRPRHFGTRLHAAIGRGWSRLVAVGGHQ
ncbi:protein of unknown function [Paraburkholderia kururiensis]